MRKKIALFAILLLTLACQVIPTPPPLKSPRPSPSPSPVFFTPTVEASPSPGVAPSATPTARSLADLPVFPVRSGEPFTPLEPSTWQPAPLPEAAELPLPAALSDLTNPQVIAGLTLRQQAQLLHDGFVIALTQEEQFSQIRQRVATCNGQPYYLTTDAAYHAVDLTLDELLRTLEQEELHRRLLATTQATLDELLAYQPLVRGQPLEADVMLAAAYLSVGLRLLDPQAAIDPRLEPAVNAQVQQVLAARGVEASSLIPDYRDDFRRYRPGGHYASGDLADYYRGLTWFGRAVFPLESGRAPLLITLALRRARIDPTRLPTGGDQPQPAADEYARLYSAITFLRGRGPGYGPAEYAVLMDQVYGPGVTIVGLANDELWNRFSLYARELPPEQVSAAPVNLLAGDTPMDGWRWLSTGFQLDNFILQSLEDVRLERSAGPTPGVAEQPQLPSGLDVMAVLGASAAPEALQAIQAGDLSAYTAQVEQMKALATRLPLSGWDGSAAGIGLYALMAQLVDKGVAFPGPMHSPGWKYKDLNTALGAWVGLRSGPIPEGVPSSAAPATPTPAPALVSTPTPAYVEPNPEVFYRLAFLTNSLAEGLTQRGLVGLVSVSAPDPGGLRQMVQETLSLGDRLQRLGDIAAAELSGQPPEADAWALIASPLGSLEARLASQSCPPRPDRLPPLSRLIALSNAAGEVQYAATGGVNRIYVLARFGDELMVTQGGVYSYYEFPEAVYGPLDEAEWRNLLANQLIDPPGWVDQLRFPEGSAVDVLAFRPGYAYRVNSAGGRVNVRREPGRNAVVVRQLSPGSEFTIIDGPRQADGFTWWQVRVETGNGDAVEGWLVENQLWYALIR